MKTKSILTLIIIISLAITSCNKNQTEIYPSNNVTEVEKQLIGSSKLMVSDLFNVYINFSEAEEQIIIEANENIHSQIQVRESNGTLSIDLKDRLNIQGPNLVLNAFITTKSINSIDVSGGSKVELLDVLTVNDLEIEVTGASHMKGVVLADYIFADITGASEIDLSGSSNNIDIYAKGSSKLHSYNFQCENLEADLAGASRVFTTVNQKLNVKATGASSVYYKGDGIISYQNLSGASEIIKVY